MPLRKTVYRTPQQVSREVRFFLGLSLLDYNNPLICTLLFIGPI